VVDRANAPPPFAVALKDEDGRTARENRRRSRLLVWREFGELGASELEGDEQRRGLGYRGRDGHSTTGARACRARAGRKARLVGVAFGREPLQTARHRWPGLHKKMRRDLFNRHGRQEAGFGRSSVAAGRRVVAQQATSPPARAPLDLPRLHSGQPCQAVEEEWGSISSLASDAMLDSSRRCIAPR